MEKIRRSQTQDPMPELKYLPMFYLFPKELLDASPFSGFPRNPYTVRESEHWMKAYNSEKFVETLADGVAGMVWRHFGIKASMESFSGYHPFWVLARSGDWVEVAARYGFNTYSLATLHVGSSSRFCHLRNQMPGFRCLWPPCVARYRWMPGGMRWPSTLPTRTTNPAAKAVGRSSFFANGTTAGR